MTKKDLKPGMVVEYANGELKIVFPSANGELFLAGMDWWGSLSSFTEDLKCTILTDYNIQKVYTIKYGHTLPDIIDNKRNCLTLLWERPEEKVELTLEEIAEKFNIPVESLRIKD